MLHWNHISQTYHFGALVRVESVELDVIVLKIATQNINYMASVRRKISWNYFPSDNNRYQISSHQMPAKG